MYFTTFNKFFNIIQETKKILLYALHMDAYLLHMDARHFINKTKHRDNARHKQNRDTVIYLYYVCLARIFFTLLTRIVSSL